MDRRVESLEAALAYAGRLWRQAPQVRIKRSWIMPAVMALCALLILNQISMASRQLHPKRRRRPPPPPTDKLRLLGEAHFQTMLQARDVGGLPARQRALPVLAEAQPQQQGKKAVQHGGAAGRAAASAGRPSDQAAAAQRGGSQGWQRPAIEDYGRQQAEQAAAAAQRQQAEQAAAAAQRQQAEQAAAAAQAAAAQQAAAVAAGGRLPAGPLLGVLVPVWCNAEHARALLAHLRPLLHKQGVRHAVHVAEQPCGQLFDPGALVNLAYIAATSGASLAERPDYIAFLRPTLLPDAGVPFGPPSGGFLHLGGSQSGYSYRLPYEAYCGGAWLADARLFEAAGGLSNSYVGYEGLEDDFCRRLALLTGESEVRRPAGGAARFLSLDDAGGGQLAAEHRQHNKHVFEHRWGAGGFDTPGDGIGALLRVGPDRMAVVEQGDGVTWWRVDLPEGPASVPGTVQIVTEPQAAARAAAGGGAAQQAAARPAEPGAGRQERLPDGAAAQRGLPSDEAAAGQAQHGAQSAAVGVLEAEPHAPPAAGLPQQPTLQVLPAEPGLAAQQAGGGELQPARLALREEGLHAAQERWESTQEAAVQLQQRPLAAEPEGTAQAQAVVAEQRAAAGQQAAARSVPRDGGGSAARRALPDEVLAARAAAQQGLVQHAAASAVGAQQAAQQGGAVQPRPTADAEWR